MNETKLALRVRDRRALIVGAVVLALVVAVRMTMPVLDALRGARERNQILADALAHSTRRPAAEALADSLARLSRALDSARAQLLPAGSGSAVASHLHASVRRAATDVGLTVHSSRAEADSGAADRFVAAMVRLDAEGDVSNLMQFLLLLELAPGLLRLSEVSIAPLEPTSRDDRPEFIRLSMTIEGIAPRRDAAIRTESR